MAATYITRTPGSTGTQTKFTFSFWVKITSAGNGADKAIFSSGLNSSNYYMIRFTSGDQLQILSKDNGNNQINYNTNQVFRDTNAWYHIVLAHDTTQSSGSRIKYYVNGEQVSSFQSSVEPSASANILYVNDTTVHAWGRRNYNSDLYTDMVLSHVHFCDGYAYQASDFGSTDSTTGEWKINTSPSVTYGTNGFFILKDGNSVTDQSGNGNNFTVGSGTLTKTEDCPSNVFCTMNPLVNYQNGTPTFSRGNNNIDGSGSAWMRTVGTLGNRTGKFYYEALVDTYYGDSRPVRLGWDSIDFINPGGDNYYSGLTISSDGYIRGGINGYNNYDPNGTSLGGSFTQGDYIGLAIDLDNDLIYCYKNGTVFSGTNGLDISSNTNCSIKKSHGYQVSPSLNFYSGSAGDNKVYFNFGNGSFGTTQLTGTTYQDSNGQGVFKYQPPTNYLAWCTKNFNV